MGENAGGKANVKLVIVRLTPFPWDERGGGIAVGVHQGLVGDGHGERVGDLGWIGEGKVGRGRAGYWLFVIEGIAVGQGKGALGKTLFLDWVEGRSSRGWARNGPTSLGSSRVLVQNMSIVVRREWHCVKRYSR